MFNIQTYNIHSLSAC